MRIRSAPACPRRGARGETECGSVCDLRPVDLVHIVFCTIGWPSVMHHCARPTPQQSTTWRVWRPHPPFSFLCPRTSLSLVSPPNHFSDSKLSQQTQRAGLSRTPRRPIPHLRQLVLNRGRAPARRGATPTPPHRLSGSSPGLPALRSRPPLSLAAPGPIAAFVAPASRAQE